MAVIKLASPISGIRGKLGGVVFSAGKAGGYIKPWRGPVKMRTVGQGNARSQMALVRAQWGTLSQGQIDDWNALAASPPELDYNAFGEQIFLSGSQWHTRVNLRRLWVGDAIVNDAPVNASVSAPATFGLTVYESKYLSGVDEFSYTDGDFSGVYAILEVAITASGVRQVAGVAGRQIYGGAVVGATSTEITSAMIETFGVLAAGSKCFGLLYRQSTTGIRSVAVAATTIVLPEP